MTVFMREARELIRSADPDCVVSAIVQHSNSIRGDDTPYADNLRGLLVDLKTWARENLIDAVVAAGYYRGEPDPKAAYEEMRRETEGRVPVWLYGWLDANRVPPALHLAEELGAPELLLWESDYIGLPPANPELVKVMRDYADEGILPST